MTVEKKDNELGLIIPEMDKTKVVIFDAYEYAMSNIDSAIKGIKYIEGYEEEIPLIISKYFIHTLKQIIDFFQFQIKEYDSYTICIKCLEKIDYEISEDMKGLDDYLCLKCAKEGEEQDNNDKKLAQENDCDKNKDTENLKEGNLDEETLEFLKSLYNKHVSYGGWINITQHYILEFLKEKFSLKAVLEQDKIINFKDAD